MPIYTYRCACGLHIEHIRAVSERDVLPVCLGCAKEMPRVLGAPLFRFKGRVTPGGGPDKFTADMLGMRLDELPVGLRTEKQK